MLSCTARRTRLPAATVYSCASSFSLAFCAPSAASSSSLFLAFLTSLQFALHGSALQAGSRCAPMAMSASAVDVRTIVYSRSSPEGIKLVTRPPASLPTGSDKVLCRVVCAGINPVDAKGLVGDKVFTVCEW